MFDKKELCNKIIEIYPDIGACGIDVTVDYDEKEKAYVVHLEKDGRRLKTYLQDGDAENCISGKQCVSLGIEIAQLRDNVQKL
ncbi:MAG: hypothetical protein RBT11_00670 [Desulfobacterales bacterium]|jgi:hypothetical protein|nr:hypothetical protein [Desulfobacterales bacterium]